MTRQELRVFLGTWFCGCGAPDLAAGALLRLLRLSGYGERLAREAWIADEGLRYLLLYRLDQDGLIEHGTNVDGAWLTDKGKALAEALLREEDDHFKALFVDHCACGYDLNDTQHDCFSPERSEGAS